ncbi:hypothetical protein G9A89_003373 [Geosiphon pyriformis]|nr:hypothetical protein G9A89_003373 [Geosiphon pyriformis]
MNFPDIDIEKLHPQTIEFALPDTILTEEVMALRSSRPVTRSQKRGGKPRTYNADTSDDDDIFLNHSNGSTKASTGARHKSTSLYVQSKLAAYKPYRRGSRTKNLPKVEDKQIASWAEQPVPAPIGFNPAFKHTPFLKQTTPSVIAKGPYKLEAKKIQETFITNSFASYVAAWLEAAESLEQRDAMDIDPVQIQG